MPKRVMILPKNDNIEKKITKKVSLKNTKYNLNKEIERLLIWHSNGVISHGQHNVFPAFNVSHCPQDDGIILPYYPTCAFSTPNPIYVASKHCDQVDLCHKRPMAREYYRKRLITTRTTYQRAFKNKQIRAVEKENIYHSSVFDMAERTELQPDPYFHNSYDYYYTNGNLCSLPSSHLIHVSGNTLQTLEIGEFPNTPDITKVNALHSIATSDITTGSEIFEIIPLSNDQLSTSYLNCFLSRQRNAINFHFLTSSLKLKTTFEFKSKTTPFIGTALSHHNPNILLISTMKQHVRHYDLDQDTPKLVTLYNLSKKNASPLWNTIKPWQQNVFLYANEYKFMIIDLRTTINQWLQSATSKLDDTYICDHISSIGVSHYDNLCYMATNHKLYCLDVRYIKNDMSLSNSESTVCCWTHQCEYAPLMLTSHCDNDSEYIALSSPIAGDINICELTRSQKFEKCTLSNSAEISQHQYTSFCLVYQPPTLIELYENARLNGFCLEPEANLQTRLKCCTTGLTFHQVTLNEKKNLLLCYANSNGDVYAYKVTERENCQSKETRANELSNSIMNEYAQEICSFKQPSLFYSDIVSLEGLRKVFRCKYLNKSNYDSETENQSDGTNKIHSRRFGRWQKSFKTLHSYKDLLVEKILSIWDIDNNEIDGDGYDNDASKIKTKNILRDKKLEEPLDKVNNWLNYQTREDSNKINNQIGNNSQISNNTLNDTQTSNLNIHDDELILTQFESQTEKQISISQNSLNANRTKKRTKSYVKGF